MASTEPAALRETPLADLHRRRGARLVDFAGWRMPLSYPEGTVAEHERTRAAASLFDVAHMGAVTLAGEGAAAGLERLTPAGITTLAPERQRYALLTTDDGGILDDVMVANTGEALLVVVNAARREADLARLREGLPDVEVVTRDDLGLLALQGPAAEAVLAAVDPRAATLRFMDAATLRLDGTEAWASRSGYTGEDGFELLVPTDRLEGVAERLLADERVGLAGLGARDTLRLEAGLCLHGADLDETTSPVEAALAWSIPKRRRAEGGFPGAARIAAELDAGPARLRVGLRPVGRRPVRAGAPLRDTDGVTVGVVTSGGWGPSVGGPVAMGYVPPALAASRPTLAAEVRGREVAVDVVDLPFVTHRYRRS